MKINHIGYAVKRIDRAMESFRALGFDFGPIIDDIDRNIKISFGEKDGYCIELVSPLDKTVSSPVDSYISSGAGTPYHICYESDDFFSDIKALENQGFKVIVPPKPAVALGGANVVFLLNLGFGIMEIVERN